MDKIKAGVVATNGCLVTMPNVSASIGVECGETAQINCITKAVDIPTIGHDDGNNCLSHSDWGWCWCKGI